MGVPPCPTLPEVRAVPPDGLDECRVHESLYDLSRHGDQRWLRAVAQMDVHAAIEVPHFDCAVSWFVGENFTRSQLGIIVVAAHDQFRRRDMRLRVEEKASVGPHPWHGMTPSP